MPDIPRRLSQYPYGRLQIRCSQCRRQGSWSVARLAVRFGAEIDLGDLLIILTAGCRWQRSPLDREPRKYEARCLAYYPGLVPPDPPGAPAVRLRLVEKVEGRETPRTTDQPISLSRGASSLPDDKMRSVRNVAPLTTIATS